MKRRNAIGLVVIGSAAPVMAQQHRHDPAGTPPAAPRFLSRARFQLVELLAEMIVPSDAHSPGAREAGVAAFIDETAADSTPQHQSEWTRGLDAVDAEAARLHGKAFAACSPAQRDGILAAMAAGEDNPKTALHRFFVLLKARTISGYYTSSTGLLKDLQYKGIVPLAAFPSCEHQEHPVKRR